MGFTKKMPLPRARTKFKVTMRAPSGEAVCSCRDLSIAGIRVRGSLLAVPGEHIRVTLDLPAPYGITIPARVSWGHADGPGNYVVGAWFEHTYETRTKLKKIIEEVKLGRMGITRSPADTFRKVRS